MKLLPNDQITSALDGRLRTAVELAIDAGTSTLKWFGTSTFHVERKGDDSPVTIADKHAETMIRQALVERFPNDSILGEEFGERTGESEYRWIVDPIDGTKSFISGVPLYSTLVGIVHNGKSVGGVIFLPGLNEIVFAVRGYGAWYSRNGETARKCNVSTRQLGDGLFVLSQVDNFGKQGLATGYLAIEKEAYITRSWGDGYGYLLVATGRAEVMVDPIANPWDLAAVQPVIEEAGGRFTSLAGEDTFAGGNGIGSNGLVHQRALELLRS